MSTRRTTWTTWLRPVLAIIVSSLSLLASLGLTAGAAAAQQSNGGGPKKTTTTTIPTDSSTTTTVASTGGGGPSPKLTAVASLSRHRVLATYDRDLDAAALQMSSYAFYSTQAVNLPVLGVSRATNNQAFVLTEAQEPVTYEVKKPKTPRPVTFTGSTVTEPKVVSATPVSTTQIIVTFSEAVGTSAVQPSAYQLTVEGSTTALAVTKAAVFGSSQTQVLLTTAPQEAVPYVLTVVGNVQSTSGAYIDPTAMSIVLSGSTVAAGPMLLSAVSQGDTGLLLTFDAALGSSATETTRYKATPSLSIKSAVLQSGNTQVFLTTGPQYAVSYTIVADVVDETGRAVNQNFDTGTFTGSVTVSTDRPKVTSAGSTGNTSVVVQFSQPMADNAADPSHYAIVQANVNPEVGAVPVTAAAFVDADRLSVKLTTRSQNEVTYQVTASNVTDVNGNPLADKVTSNGVLVDPTSATFPGTPPSGAELVNADCRPGDTADGDPPLYCDTLFDNQEYLGWLVTVKLANDTTNARQATSNPDLDDTDGDLLTDDVEKALGTDPRDGDTDDDGLDDNAEFNEYFSDPTNQDSDGDGLYDGLEATFFNTSPLFDDTDGDQLKDDYEINVNRNPKVADLPAPVMTVGEMNLLLDVQFEHTNSEGVRDLETKTVESTLTQSSSQEYSTTDSATHELVNRSSHTLGLDWKFGYEEGSGVNVATFSYEGTTEKTNTNSLTTDFTQSSEEATEEAYSKSLETAREVSYDTTVTRTVEDAAIKLALVLESKGNVAFTVSNLQVAALIQDPYDSTRLTPIATLVPESGPETTFNLGPLVPPKGPVVFTSIDVFPQLVEDLLRNPRGVVFRFANYDVLDEAQRNFAFTSQEVNDRTARVALDFGGYDPDLDGRGKDTEILRVATGIIGRVVDGSDHKVIFDGQGKQVGITLRDALAVAGLTAYDEAVTPSASLSPAQQESSYSTIMTTNGFERVYRVRGRKIEAGSPRTWEILTPTGIDRTMTLDQRILYPGTSVTLSFLEDKDDDRLPAVLEAMRGCSDDAVDTDGDTLDDQFEVIFGWGVNLHERGVLKVHSRCWTPDSDGDGMTDREEAPGIIQGATSSRDTSGEADTGDGVDLALGHEMADPITDPLSKDTDGDGLTDKKEVEGYANLKPSPPYPPDTYTAVRKTSPERFNSDKDAASDGVEARLGGDPRVEDFEAYGDRDQDGLIDAQECDDTNLDGKLGSLEIEKCLNALDSDHNGSVSDSEKAFAGWDVVVIPMNPRNPERALEEVCKDGKCPTPVAAAPKRAYSIRDKLDTDGDGLSDYEEFKLKTDPGSEDTDEDGLSDYEEERGFKLHDIPLVKTNPLKVDTDNDKRSDGEEAGEGEIMVVRMDGKAPYEVFSHPLKADTDMDLLVDGDEQLFGTATTNYNTDEDTSSDYGEVLAERRPLVPDFHVTLTFGTIVVSVDGDVSGGRGAGDIIWDLGVTKPDGTRLSQVTKYGSIVDGDQVQKVDGEEIFLNDGTNPPYCSNSYRSAAGCIVDIKLVSTTPAVYEEFGITGFIRELDGGETDCGIGFPGAALPDGDKPGTMAGSDLKPGVQTWSLHRKVTCQSGDAFEITLYLSVSAK